MVRTGLWLQFQGHVIPVLWETTDLFCSLPKSLLVHAVKPLDCLPGKSGCPWHVKPRKVPRPPSASQLPSKPVVCMTCIPRSPPKIHQNFFLHSPNYNHIILNTIPLRPHSKRFLLPTPKSASRSLQRTHHTSNCWQLVQKSITLLVSAWSESMHWSTVLAITPEMYLDKHQCWGGAGSEYVDHRQVLNQTR